MTELELDNQILQKLPKDTTICNKTQSQYLFTYHFSQRDNVAIINFYYDKNGKITKKLAKNNDAFSQAILKHLEYITHLTKQKNISCEFAMPQLEKQYSDIKRLLETNNVAIKEVESLRYRQRYTFIRTHNDKEQEAIFDISYNKYGQSYVNNLESVRGDKEFIKYLREILLIFLESNYNE